MTCESFATALVEGHPPSEAEAAHTRDCPACARLAASLRLPGAPPAGEAPPRPDARTLTRAVRRARLRESGLVALAAAVLLGVAIGQFEAHVPPAAPLVAEVAPEGSAADAALLALVEGLDGLSEPPPDLADRDFLDVLDPYPSEPIVTFGEL